jgi:predicted nucleic acid-binding Zn ribbon protein
VTPRELPRHRRAGRSGRSGPAGRGTRRPDGAGHWRRSDDDGWDLEDQEDASRTARVPAPTPVAAEFGRLFARPGWAERLGVARLAGAWADVVGPDLAAHCEPVRIAGRVLTVRAATGTWATQLKWFTVQLAERAQELLGEGSVTEVRIVVGPLGAAEPRHTGGEGPAPDHGGARP